jgi:hypothetical protein
VRGSQAIIDVVESGDTKLRLLLGEMAYKMAAEKLDMLKENFETYKELTIGSDFPENER